MGRTLLLVAIGLFVVAVADPVDAKKVKTGVVVDETRYVDNLHGFSIAMNKNWKIKPEKEDPPKKTKIVRFKMTNNARTVPARRSEDSWTFPYGAMLVDTTSLSAADFAAFLNSDDKSTRKSKRWKAFAKVCEMLIDGDFMGESDFRWHGLSGKVLTYRYDYEIQVVVRSRNEEFELVSSHRLAQIYLAKRGGKIYAFHFETENEDYRQMKEEIETVLQSLRFEGEKGYDPRLPADSSGT